MAAPNGEHYLLPADKAQGLANYPHARAVPAGARILYVSGISSRRGDGSYVGCTENADGTFTKDCFAQTAAVLSNIEAVIKGATDGKCGLESVIDATVFLVDMEGDYKKMNAAWNDVWPDRTKAPARTTVQVTSLPGKKIAVEIKCQALIS